MKGNAYLYGHTCTPVHVPQKRAHTRTVHLGHCRTIARHQQLFSWSWRARLLLDCLNPLSAVAAPSYPTTTSTAEAPIYELIELIHRVDTLNPARALMESALLIVTTSFALAKVHLGGDDDGLPT